MITKTQTSRIRAAATLPADCLVVVVGIPADCLVVAAVLLIVAGEPQPFLVVEQLLLAPPSVSS